MLTVCSRNLYSEILLTQLLDDVYSPKQTKNINKTRRVGGRGREGDLLDMTRKVIPSNRVHAHFCAPLWTTVAMCFFSQILLLQVLSILKTWWPLASRNTCDIVFTKFASIHPLLQKYIRFAKKKRSEQTATERRPVCGDSFSVRCTTSKRLCVLSRYLQPMGLHRFNTLPSFGGKLLDQRKHVVFNGTPYFTCRPRNRSQASTKRSRCESRVLFS